VKRYFLVPIHSTPLLLVVTFALGLRLAVAAGLAGIPLGFLLFSWFFKYCFVLFDSVVAGEDEPPVLSVEMVNPVSEQRLLVLAALVVAEGMLLTRVGYIAVALMAILLPAHVAVLGYTGNVFKAIWPPSLVSLAVRLGRDYLLIIAVMLLVACAAYWTVTRGLALFYVLVVMQLLLLLMFALVGGAMFEHRLELGIDSRTRREWLKERDLREHAADRARMLDVAYRKFQVHRSSEGWEEIASWLRIHTDLSEHRAILSTASTWDDVRVADKLANELVTILLSRRATGEALFVVEQRLNTNPKYQVMPRAAAIRMAELADAAGKKALQRRLLVLLPGQAPQSKPDERGGEGADRQRQHRVAQERRDEAEDQRGDRD